MGSSIVKRLEVEKIKRQCGVTKRWEGFFNHASVKKHNFMGKLVKKILNDFFMCTFVVKKGLEMTLKKPLRIFVVYPKEGRTRYKCTIIPSAHKPV